MLGILVKRFVPAQMEQGHPGGPPFFSLLLIT